jgi:hypothetical protein
MREDLSRDEVVAVIDRTVEELLQAARVQAPPVDALALAERHLGLVLSPDGGRPRRGQRKIPERPEPSAERRQWLAAHAIGEHFKPTVLQRLGIDPQQPRALMGESLANLFAARLLVPSAWFAAAAPAADYDVPQLKERYRSAGFEVVALRLLDLPEPCIITFVENGRVQRRRSNAWRVRRELSPAERECQRYVTHHGRPKVVRAGGWTVQGWPAPGGDGTRVLLRSVVEEGEAPPAD